MSLQTSLYEKLGGKDSIGKVVDRFYDKVLADSSVNYFFENIDMENQRKHQTKFLSFALGGPAQYSGKSMAKVHEGMNLQPEHFDAIVLHLKEALQEFNVPEQDIETAVDHVNTLRDDILYK
ncbi:group 1 truncated hemoglobin [Fictibacillus sp. WQ 8-8]|nr:group 1 truncated hemoglobin [Fictibacillus sp. WQ 8-8]MCQ6266912.1 group 1 truncated hemoglobin [Fictibacillus sp. WQ 8-8]